MERDEVISLVDHFYNSVLRDRVRDGAIDAQWNWFLNKVRQGSTSTRELSDYFRKVNKENAVLTRTGLSEAVDNRQQTPRNGYLSQNTSGKHLGSSNKKQIKLSKTASVKNEESRASNSYTVCIGKNQYSAKHLTKRFSQRPLSTFKTSMSNDDTSYDVQNEHIIQLERLLQIFSETQTQLM